MKLKAVSRFSGERTVKAILEERLEKTPLQVWGKVRLSSIIGPDADERLPDDLFQYFTRAELDYLIFERSAPNIPVLAVEFDGPQHASDPQVAERDRLKNRLCRMCGITSVGVEFGVFAPSHNLQF